MIASQRRRRAGNRHGMGLSSPPSTSAASRARYRQAELHRPAQHLPPRGHGSARVYLRKRRPRARAGGLINFFPSWPGLSRPSTSCFLPRKYVDARDICAKMRFALLPGHDERLGHCPELSTPHSPSTPCSTSSRHTLERRNAAVLVAPPGAGKTTRVPLALLDAPWAQGPENRDAGAAPRRRPRQRRADGEETRRTRRETVGYRVRFGSKISARTRVEVVTKGIFTLHAAGRSEL